MAFDFLASLFSGSWTVEAISANAKATLAERIGSGAVGFTADGGGFAKFLRETNAAGLVTMMRD